jgi:hypothetical protein
MRKRRNHFDTAERNGREANLRGLPRSDNPYAQSNAQWISESPVPGALTWIQTWHERWNDGWDKAEREIEARARIRKVQKR